MRTLFLAALLVGCPTPDADKTEDSQVPGHDEACDGPEVCDGVDNNCNGDVDEGLTATFWIDADGDGFGDVAGPTDACEPPDGYVNNADDCDDAGGGRFPGNPELCNEVDDDCDGNVDEESEDAITVYADTDADGFGDATSSAQACGLSEGWTLDATDCDDTLATVNPSASETCNGRDDDCDDETDEDDAIDAAIWYLDSDSDGYGRDDATTLSCEQPAWFAALGGDCDDGEVAFNPGAAESDCLDPNDYNCDGSTAYADVDGDGWAACGECDDTDASVNPAHAEVCDGVDNDCDGGTDETDAVDVTVWYADVDDDGFGDATTATSACDAPLGYVDVDGDCDDTIAAVNPDAVETCNGVDDDCDGTADEDGASDASVWYADTDGDSYGDASVPETACDAPADYVVDASDCDDGRALTHPGATEYCNSTDDDCDGTVDNAAADALSFYQDADGDGYGDASVSTDACSAPSGYVADDTDCDDVDAAVNPGATETCNLADDDCDGSVDEGASATTWYSDADGDGYGDASVSSTDCSAPTGYVSDDTDCDDTDDTVNPAATDSCDSIDNDCDGTVDGSGCTLGYGGHRIDKDGSYYYALYNDRGFGILDTSSWYGSSDAASSPEGVTWNEDQTVLYYNDLNGNVFAQSEPFDATSTLIGRFALGQIGGGVVFDDTYYVGDYAGGNIYAMDVATGSTSLYASLGSTACKPYFGNNAMSIDEDGKVYVASSCGIVVYEPGVPAIQLNSYTGLISAVAMDASQELYSLDYSGNIVHFDKSTGATLSTVRISYSPSTTWTLAIDESDNILVNYWGEQRVYDLATGALVTTFNASVYYPGTSRYYWYVTW